MYLLTKFYWLHLKQSEESLYIYHVLSFSSLVNRICLTHTFHEFSKFTSIADIHFRNFNEHRKPYILLHLPSNAYSGVS